jgi:hypothetical protein
MMISDAQLASMSLEPQAEHHRFVGTEEEQHRLFMARGAEPFGLNVYSPEQWRRRRRLDVIRIVYADGSASSRRRSRRR